MILPTKHLPPERALLSVGAEVLARLRGPMTVSALWDGLRRDRGEAAPLSYDWFVLALDLLYTVGAIDLSQGLVRKSHR